MSHRSVSQGLPLELTHALELIFINLFEIIFLKIFVNIYTFETWQTSSNGAHQSRKVLGSAVYIRSEADGLICRDLKTSTLEESKPNDSNFLLKRSRKYN